MITVLILGGTSEAASLAEVLSDDSTFRVITSLAGRTNNPRKPSGEMRVGGFGGIEGLTDYLRDRGIDAVIDATHPFARQMSVHAAAACQELAIPRLYLERAPWVRLEGEVWHEVHDAEEAAVNVKELGHRVFLSSGHQDLDVFAKLDDHWFLIRTVEPIVGITPKHWHWVQARGPFSKDDEVDLLREHHIDVVVTKASGGKATYAKIAAARQLDLPVIMIRRPAPPDGPKAESLNAAQTWLQRQVTG